MTRSLLASAIVVALGASIAFGAIYDLNPAPWRTTPPGIAPTTYQSWSFSTSANPSAPDVDDNPFGTAALEVTGGFPLTRYYTSFNGHDGVWKFEDWIEIVIPNSPIANPYKEVWLQITYYASGIPEAFTVLPAYDNMQLVSDVAVDDYFRHATYSIRIEPNPVLESVWIEPLHCTLYVDNLIVETICVPEPVSLAMLAFGGLVAIRRRR